MISGKHWIYRFIETVWFPTSTFEAVSAAYYHLVLPITQYRIQSITDFLKDTITSFSDPLISWIILYKESRPINVHCIHPESNQSQCLPPPSNHGSFSELHRLNKQSSRTPRSLVQSVFPFDWVILLALPEVSHMGMLTDADWRHMIRDCSLIGGLRLIGLFVLVKELVDW